MPRYSDFPCDFQFVTCEPGSRGRGGDLAFPIPSLFFGEFTSLLHVGTRRKAKGLNGHPDRSVGLVDRYLVHTGVATAQIVRSRCRLPPPISLEAAVLLAEQ